MTDLIKITQDIFLKSTTDKKSLIQVIMWSPNAEK